MDGYQHSPIVTGLPQGLVSSRPSEEESLNRTTHQRTFWQWQFNFMCKRVKINKYRTAPRQQDVKGSVQKHS